MTANPATSGIAEMLNWIVNAGRMVLRTMSRLALAVLIIFAAGFIAVATAFAGLFLAGVALILRYTKLRDPERRTATSGGTTTKGVTLEARQTARGWTVE